MRSTAPAQHLGAHILERRRPLDPWSAEIPRMVRVTEGSKFLHRPAPVLAAALTPDGVFFWATTGDSFLRSSSRRRPPPQCSSTIPAAARPGSRHDRIPAAAGRGTRRRTAPRPRAYRPPDRRRRPRSPWDAKPPQSPRQIGQELAQGSPPRPAWAAPRSNQSRRSSSGGVQASRRDHAGYRYVEATASFN
jgi:hypothetical protein